jgi:DNA-binding transcriptional LysR family regulator
MHFNALFAAVGAPAPERPIECNSLVAARAFLLESDSMMLLSTHQIHYELKARMLVPLPHPSGNVVRPIGLTQRRDWRPTPAQGRLLECLRERASALMHGASGQEDLSPRRQDAKGG